MKRFLSFTIMSIIAVCCVMMCGLSLVRVDTVTEDAMVGYGECENHLFGEYIEVGKATCITTATKYRTCAVCGFIDRVDLPKDPDNHSDVSDFVTYDPKPTCVSGGIQYKICYACNKPAESVALDADPNAHAPKGNYEVLTQETCRTVGEKAYQCRYCDEYYAHEEIPVNSEKHVVTEDSIWHVLELPACSVDGVMFAYCDLCGKEAERRSVPATGKHVPDTEWTVDKEETCVADGLMSHHCTECGVPCDETVIPANSGKHTFSDEFTVDVKADCISEGSMSRHCIYCDATTDVYPIDIDPTAHLYLNDWIITKEPSCSSMGLKHKVCILCEKESVPTMIEKTAHTYPETYEVLKESTDGLSVMVKYICEECSYEYVTILVLGSTNPGGDLGDGSDLTEINAIIPVDNTVIKVDNKNMIISNIARNMTVDTFMSNFKNASIFVVYDENDKFRGAGEYIATGCRLNFETVDGKVTNYYVSVTGDIDSDGKVNAADARRILRAAAKIETLTGAYYIAADVNLDGAVNATDARKTLRVAADLEYFEETYEY